MRNANPAPSPPGASAATPAASPAAQKIGGRYKILSLLGSGAMGSVYRVLDTELEVVVALKMIPSGGFATEIQRQRFRAEASAASTRSREVTAVVITSQTVAGPST